MQKILTKKVDKDTSEECSEGALDVHRRFADSVNLNVPRSVKKFFGFAEEVNKELFSQYKYPISLKVPADENKCDHMTPFLYSSMIPQSYRAHKVFAKSRCGVSKSGSVRAWHNWCSHS